MTALRDRDSVRGFPLSTGFANQRTRTIEGYYDKYRYDSDGKLIGIPSVDTTEPEIDRSLRIPRYHVLEQDGYIWVWMGPGKPTGQPEEIPYVGEFIWHQQTQIIQADPALCIQHEMDWPSSLVQDRLRWAYRRAVVPLLRSIKLDQPYEVRSKENGIELFQPALKDDAARPRDARVTTFSLPDRVVHQKLLKRKFWRGFGDFVSVAHFIPEIDPLTGKTVTRAEYMWTPLLLPGYAFQRNKITTLPHRLWQHLPSYRHTDKAVLETLQQNVEFWRAVDELDVNPCFVDVDTLRKPPPPPEGVDAAAEPAPTPVQAHQSVSALQSINSLALIDDPAVPAFGGDVLVDSPAQAVNSIMHLAAKGEWNLEKAHLIVPGGRHIGKFRVTHSDS